LRLFVENCATCHVQVQYFREVRTTKSHPCYFDCCGIVCIDWLGQDRRTARSPLEIIIFCFLHHLPHPQQERECVVYWYSIQQPLHRHNDTTKTNALWRTLIMATSLETSKPSSPSPSRCFRTSEWQACTQGERCPRPQFRQDSDSRSRYFCD